MRSHPIGGPPNCQYRNFWDRNSITPLGSGSFAPQCAR
jgi:hypothetical protein